MLFLADNGFKIMSNQLDLVRLMEAVADGTMEEEAVAHWFRARLVR